MIKTLKGKNIFKALTILFIIVFTIGCKETYTPKPRGYFRFNFPERSYSAYKSECSFVFEYPVYAEVKPVKESYAEACWYNINIKSLNATVYLTYKPLQKNLDKHVEDLRTIVYKHTIKADDIVESVIDLPENKVYGILYDIQGNTATSLNFYITDSTTNFLSGALYFNAQPNKDSLAPAVAFLQEDVVHLIHTFHWK